MLFSSATYLFAFLPVALIGYYLLLAVSRDLAKVFVIAASLFFYGWASAHFLPLLSGSVIVNYLLGRAIIAAYARDQMSRVALMRTIGVLGNLALLIYFKYTNFFIENVNAVTDIRLMALNIVLPLGISFFTFQRIAYLIDCARGEVSGGSFVDFAAISLFFPQLISGPIALYGEMKPQFASQQLGSKAGANLTVGLVILTIGLFKKVVIADNAGYACDPIFDAIRSGGNPGAFAAWLAIFTYTAQLYFDFSGYSDMAIGTARMFGVRLPLNFHSPLRASSVIEYWRRWHMTLNRFMVRYFLPMLSLRLTRAAVASRVEPRTMFFVSIVLPVFITFVVIGIWHGASWTYVAFGVLHAIYVSVNEVWRNAKKRRRKRQGKPARAAAMSPRALAFGFGLTLLCVIIANVLFRTGDIPSALAFYRAMLGLGDDTGSGAAAFNRPQLLLLVAAGWFMILFLPNTQQIMRLFRPAVNWSQWKDVGVLRVTAFICWRPNLFGLAACGAVLAVAITAMIIGMSRGPAQFVYFQF